MAWAFVGRERELDELLVRLDGGVSHGVVLAGPAGVGKTRLATEFLKRAAARPGIATAHVAATQSTTRVPFGAVASLLPAGDYPEASVESRAQMLRSAGAALVRTSGDRRLVLLVDDAHLLDDASATLVYQLVATEAAFVVATVRPSGSAPAPVVGLWKDDLVDRVEVEGLASGPIEDLLCAELGGQVDPAVTSRLAVHCRGNILFLREFVIGALRDGSLVNDTGIWRLVGQLSPSDRLMQLVETRLAELSVEERELLELVCWGDPLESDELAPLADMTVAESLERRGFLTTTRLAGGRCEIRPAHPVYGDVVRAGTPALRVPRLATLLADTVEARGVQHPRDVLRVGTWRLDGGGGSPDVMLAAAQTARWSYDFALAARLVERALAVGAGFEAALLSAELAALQGRIADAKEQLAQLAEKAATDRERALVAFARLNNEAFFNGDIDKGLRIVEDAERTTTDRDWRDEIVARSAGLLLAKHGPSRALEALEPLLATCNDRALVSACQTAAPTYAYLGRFDAALDAGERGYTVARLLSRPSEWYPWTHLYFRSHTLFLAGRYIEAERLATEQYEEALENSSVEAQGWFAWGLSRVRRERGNVRSAILHGREAVALFRQLGRPLMQRESLMDLAFAYALGGQVNDARSSLDEVTALNLRPAYLSGVDLMLSSGWVEAASGDLRRARELLLQAVDEGERVGDLVGAAAGLHALGRLGRIDRATLERLDSLAERIEGDLARTRAAHLQGLAHRDLTRLEDASAGFEALGAELLAAEAAADAADIARNAGDKRRAASNEFRSTALLNKCDGAVPPGRRARVSRDVLTRTEQETALLVAAGRSNQDIAAQLCLSLRTVEGRLQRLYFKLGVNNREELRTKLDAVQI